MKANAIVGVEQRGSPRFGMNPPRAWKTLMGFGLLLLLSGSVDLGLALYSANLADPGLRLGTLTAIATGLPVFSIGLLALLAGSLGLEARGSVLVTTVLNLIAALLILGAAVWLVLSHAAAQEAFTQEVKSVARVAMIRGLVFYTGFFGVHGLATMFGARSLRRDLSA